VWLNIHNSGIVVTNAGNFEISQSLVDVASSLKGWGVYELKGHKISKQGCPNARYEDFTAMKIRVVVFWVLTR
jgi:hypothetical protein